MHERSACVSALGARTEVARAKVNLTLEIKGRRADGYHELESLVLFADFGDLVEYRPDCAFSLSVTGPFAAALDGDNLLERAVRAYAAVSGSDPGGAFHLVKHIPVAAGLGGGSADAAAALRILASRGKPVEPAALLTAAARLGADVPCCFASKPAIMTGIGDTLHPLASLTPVPAVLVNPMRPLPTGNVFRELGAGPLAAPPAAPIIPEFAGPADLVHPSKRRLQPKFGKIDAEQNARALMREQSECVSALAAYAKARGNDLEAPARRLLPVIGDMLTMLADAPGALLSRLSGSGPTCFALFADEADAVAAADAVRHEHADWWVRAVSLS